MSKKPATRSDYDKLVIDIRKEITRGIVKVEEFLERQKVLSSWGTGRHINTYLKKRDLPRGSISQLYQDLSADLKINVRTLQQYEQFYRYFPSLKPHKNLKWSHYRFLLVESDAAKRQKWLEQIKKEKIPADELRLALMPPAVVKKGETGILRPPIRGRLFTYRLLRAEGIDGFDVPWFVDLGFASRHEAPVSSGVLDNKYLYTSVKVKDGYCLKSSDTKIEHLFTYRGVLRRVIDGDTLLVDVDLGFGSWSEQRLRLNGIDAPEMSTARGRLAKQWVRKALRYSKGLVVKTYKSDKWDRYLVDVFYLPREKDMSRVVAEGVWLNGQMVEEGVAVIWEASKG